MRVERKMVRLGILLLTFSCLCVQVLAQRATPPRQDNLGPAIVERHPFAPQVVTVLHRLNGLKMFRLLLRSGEQLGAISKLDDAFNLTGRVHTNIIAGLALDDGQTIAAWLPEAEAELEAPVVPPMPPSPPMAPSVLPGIPTPMTPAAPGAVADVFAGSPDAPDLTVIVSDGVSHTARYVGFDGLTGLSVLRVAYKNVLTSDANEEKILLGQRVRLFNPEPVPQAEASSSAANTVYVRIGETVGNVASIVRAPSGSIACVKIRLPKLSPANIGGIVVDDAGQTVGIVDAVEDGAASVLPAAVIRSAAKRVLKRQSSVPRPWLGVRGEPVAAAPLAQILRNGWKPGQAMSLLEERRGILLTSVAPGSPAAIADLRPGDVILRVNDDEIRSGEDFSIFLEEAGPGSSLRFTIARPNRKTPEAVDVTLSESLDPEFNLKWFEDHVPKGMSSSPLLAYGIETVALGPRVASRLGAGGGLLVVYVRPSSSAFKAGLRPGDVIESIAGQPVALTNEAIKLSTAGSSYSLSVVRKKQKLVMNIMALPK
jgi:S1-C subfamily serine protease